MARDPPKIPERQLFIGGEWCQTARGLRLPVINPATEESTGTIPAATAEDVESAVKASRDAFTRNKGKDIARTTGKYRAKYLGAIAAKVVEKKEELSRLEAIDCGKPYDEAAWDMKDGAPSSATMQDLVDAGILLPTTFPFKRIQLSERYPKGQARGRHWKHLKQMLQAENYHLYPADEPNCEPLVHAEALVFDLQDWVWYCNTDLCNALTLLILAFACTTIVHVCL